MERGVSQLIAIIIVAVVVIGGGILIYQGKEEIEAPLGNEVTEELEEDIKTPETPLEEVPTPTTEVVPVTPPPTEEPSGTTPPAGVSPTPPPPVEPEVPEVPEEPVVEEEPAPEEPEVTPPPEETTEPEVTTPTPTVEMAYVINGIGGTISAIDVATETVVNTAMIAPGGGAISGLNTIIVSPDETRLYVSDNRADKVIVVNVSDLSVIAEIDVDEAPNGLSVTPDGSKLYVANFDSDTVSVVDTATFAVTATISVDRSPSDVTVTPDSSKVYVTHFYNSPDDITRVLIIDTVTDTTSGEVSLPTSSRSLKTVFTPLGARAFISIQRSDIVGVIDFGNSALAKTIGGMLNPGHMIMSRNAKFVYVVAETDIVGGTTLEPKVYAISVETEKLSRQMSGFKSPRGIAETVDGSKLYVTDYIDDEIRIFDLDEDKVVKTISVGDSPIDVVIIPGS